MMSQKGMQASGLPITPSKRPNWHPSRHHMETPDEHLLIGVMTDGVLATYHVPSGTRDMGYRASPGYALWRGGVEGPQMGCIEGPIYRISRDKGNGVEWGLMAGRHPGWRWGDGILPKWPYLGVVKDDELLMNS